MASGSRAHRSLRPQPLRPHHPPQGWQAEHRHQQDDAGACGRVGGRNTDQSLTGLATMSSSAAPRPRPPAPASTRPSTTGTAVCQSTDQASVRAGCRRRPARPAAASARAAAPSGHQHARPDQRQRGGTRGSGRAVRSRTVARRVVPDGRDGHQRTIRAAVLRTYSSRPAPGSMLTGVRGGVVQRAAPRARAWRTRRCASGPWGRGGRRPSGPPSASSTSRAAPSVSAGVRRVAGTVPPGLAYTSTLVLVDAAPGGAR